MRDAPFGVPPDFRPGAAVVRERIVRIGELVEDDALAFARASVGEIARVFHAARLRRQHEFAPYARIVCRRSSERLSGITRIIR